MDGVRLMYFYPFLLTSEDDANCSFYSSRIQLGAFSCFRLYLETVIAFVHPHIFMFCISPRKCFYSFSPQMAVSVTNIMWS